MSVQAYEEGADPGYRFQVVGKAEEVQKLFSELMGKMQRVSSYMATSCSGGR